jgi:hypothetical protein
LRARLTGPQQHRRKEYRARSSPRRLCRWSSHVAPEKAFNRSLVTISNNLTKAKFLRRGPSRCKKEGSRRKPLSHIRLCSRPQSGYQDVTKMCFPCFLATQSRSR